MEEAKLPFPQDVRDGARKPQYDTFKKQRRGRLYGRTNPTDNTDRAYWRWMILTGTTAWGARQEFKKDIQDFADEDVFKRDSIWCFDRFGRTVTELPDGREVIIAGEHEDFGDDNFCVYNDVVVLLPQRAGIAHIWSYPEDVFPPTDNHAAVHLPKLNEIWIIGGYSGRACEEGKTLVFSLNLQDWSIREIETQGTAPQGYLWKFAATQHGNTITCTGGKIRPKRGNFIPNNKTFILNVDTHEWSH